MPDSYLGAESPEQREEHRPGADACLCVHEQQEQSSWGRGYSERTVAGPGGAFAGRCKEFGKYKGFCRV